MIVAAGTLGAAALVYAKWRRTVHLPRVYAGNNAQLKGVLAGLPSLQKPYEPPLLFFSWWAQLCAFLAADKIQNTANIDFRIDRLPLPAGGECGFAWAQVLIIRAFCHQMRLLSVYFTQLLLHSIHKIYVDRVALLLHAVCAQ
eukprot:TRINITY_DN53745_c0_g1_i1.p1 TRINITY_DN53745_c0_g1~~TRINITY_DN53745_c0_g1_i1.p1  ORF type:complete len:143 (+),score=14.14 TRINITY_DN53745_c0_g1_i1:1-429(+)